MRKLSDIKGEDAIEMLGNILEPTMSIISDDKVRDAFKNQSRVKCVSLILKNYKREIVEILAAMEQAPVEEYKNKINVFTLPARVLEVLNDKDLVDFFSSLPEQGETNLEILSGSATENIEEERQ